MAGNSFGQFFRVTTFGESHGTEIGVVLDGVTPGIGLTEADIQIELDRRKPGQSQVATTRNEEDVVHIISGVFEGKTTGTTLTMIVKNQDMHSNDYTHLKEIFRPGHADWAYYQKYGVRDYRGGGRASGRETIARVAAGAVVKKILERHHISIQAYTIRAGGINCLKRDMSVIEQNIVRACDADSAKQIINKILEIKANHDSIGGVVECLIKGVPAGLGEPVFDKLDADLAKAILSIGGTKGIEFGSGFKAADMLGSEHNDQMNKNGFMSNHAGGIIGGISTGAEIIFRTAFKPTPSLNQAQKSIDLHGNEVICKTGGRHDPAIFPRAVPVVESMAAIVILDHLKRQEALLK